MQLSNILLKEFASVWLKASLLFLLLLVNFGFLSGQLIGTVAGNGFNGVTCDGLPATCAGVPYTEIEDPGH